MNVNVMLSSVPLKAAQDSRTPRRCRDRVRATLSARFWSAAVLCRFARDHIDAQKPN